MLQSAEFWVGLSFFVFIGLLVWKKVPGLIGGRLDERAQAIRRELDEARRLREEAQELLADYQRKQRQADEDAKAIVDQARREAEFLASETRRSLAETLERRSRIAEEKIARAEQQAVSEVQAAAVDAAIATAEAIVKAKTPGDVGARLVDQSIRDLRGKLN